MSDPQQILNTAEGALLLRMSKAKLRELANEGQVPAFRVGTRLRYRKCDLLAWVEAEALANLDRERTHGDDPTDYGQLP